MTLSSVAGHSQLFFSAEWNKLLIPQSLTASLMARSYSTSYLERNVGRPAEQLPFCGQIQSMALF